MNLRFSFRIVNKIFRPQFTILPVEIVKMIKVRDEKRDRKRHTQNSLLSVTKYEMSV